MNKNALYQVTYWLNHLFLEELYKNIWKILLLKKYSQRKQINS